MSDYEKPDWISQEAWDSAAERDDEVELIIVGAPHLRFFHMRVLIANIVQNRNATAYENAASIAEGMQWGDDPNDDRQERYNDALTDVAKSLRSKAQSTTQQA